jgi:plasmid stability protein
MATLTIRNLEDSTKSQLRLQAARHGRSMEEEARVILRQAVRGPTTTCALPMRSRRRAVCNSAPRP